MAQLGFWSMTLLKSLMIVLCLTFTVAAQPPSEEAIVVCGRVISTSQTNQQSFVGSVEPIRRSVVGSAVDGRVLDLLFDLGDPVSGETSEQGFVGQPLVQLRTTTLDIEVETARLLTLQSQHELDELKESLPRTMALAAANLARAEAQLKYSKSSFERLQKMSGNVAAVSEVELEEALSKFNSDQESVNAAKADHEKLLLTKDLLIMKAENRLATAKQETARLKDLRIKYTIRAPFDGFVTQKSTEVGAWVTRGDALFEVVQLDPIELVVKVPQKFIGDVQRSLATSKEPVLANLVFDSVRQTLTGTVTRVVPQADLQTRNFPVRIRVDNPKIGDSYLLNPGMLGRASLSIGEPVKMMMVKKDALVLGGRTPRVYKVTGNGDSRQVISVDVTTGESIGNWIQVTGNLSDSDLVVVEGNERLRPGQKIKISEVRDDTLEQLSVK